MKAHVIIDIELVHVSATRMVEALGDSHSRLWHRLMYKSGAWIHVLRPGREADSNTK